MQLYEWDAAGFEQAYRMSYYKPKGCGVNLIHNCRCVEKDITYSRDFFPTNAMFEIRANNVVNAINLPQGSSVLVVGCALGFIMVELGALGMNPVGIDNSQYIQSIKNRPGEKISYNIHNVSITAANFKQALDRASGITEFDCIITEDVLTSYDSYQQILDNCEAVLKPGRPKSNIVHIVATDVNSPFAVKTLQQWKQVDASHTWLNGLGENR